MRPLCIFCEERPVRRGRRFYCSDACMYGRINRDVRLRRRMLWGMAGLCRACGKPRSPRSSCWCEHHKETQETRQKKRWARLQSRGRCRICGGILLGKVFCARHQAMNRESARRSRQKHGKHK